VVAALALHWVAPEVRFAKPARLLKPGGWMAFFANRPVLDGSPLRAEIDAAYARHAPHMREGAPGPTRPIDTPLAEELEAHPDFGPVWRAEFPWSQRQDRDDYLDLMRTQSDHRMLGAEARDALLTAIGEAIDRHGGHIELRWNAILSMARRS
jgi:hypothetical protein